MTKTKAKQRKLEIDVDSQLNSSDGKKIDVNHSSNACDPTANIKNLSNASWYVTEIQSMMHGFGDCKKPLFESAKLIERIIHQQMTLLLNLASEAAVARGSKTIGLEELLFVLRKDRAKLFRLINYISVRDMKVSATKQGHDAHDEENEDNVSDNKSGGNVKKNMRKVCQEFLQSIDQTGEFNAIFDGHVFDAIKHERNIRADNLSRSMTPEQYANFSAARQVSFARKYRSSKFRDWLLRSSSVDTKPNLIALEILNYFAYETVAQIVDMALLLKKDAVSYDDDVDKITSCRTLNKDFPQVQFHYNSMASGSNQFNDNLSASTNSPPPLSPNSTGAKCKPRKRTRTGGSSNYVEIPKTSAILPCDIREVVNRFMSPSNPFSFFAKNCVNFSDRRLFCS